MFGVVAEVAQGVNWWLEIAKLILPALAVCLSLWIWHLKKRSEPRYESLSYLNQKRLDGLLKAWSLLAYITEVENPKAVVLWEKNGKETVYYLRFNQAREYMIALSGMFYDGGYGLLLGREVKELFYEYRNYLYGVLLKAESKQEVGERVKLENQEMIKRMKEICDAINAELRKELKKIEK